MKWFSGDIASAIGQAKTRGAIFVVYCEGKDDNSKQMTELIDSEPISKMLESQSFVSIKVESDKEEYMQFAKIYQLVPVPSLFFIKNGIPIKIVTGTVKTVEDLENSINGVLKTDSSLGQSSTSSAPTNDNTGVVCEDGVCVKKSESSPSSDDGPSNETEEEKRERLNKAMKLIEQKRIERVKEEKRLEQEREVQRRKEGQEVQNLKKWREDQEMKELKEERLREKEEARVARQRVLDQIAQDKKERATRFNTSQSPVEPKEAPATPPAPKVFGIPNSARIQFKKPDGETEIVTFDSGMMFADLHAFVQNDILRGAVKSFTLATTFPRREFASSDFDKTLADLGLTPSSVLLIITGRKPATSNSAPTSGVLPTQTDGSFFAMLMALFTGLLTPVVSLFNYLKGFVFVGGAGGAGENANDAGKRKRNEDILTANDAAKKRNLSSFSPTTNVQPGAGTSNPSSSPTGTIPKSTAYKRPSNNIHRLHDNSSDDEDKKTYNGNSTQQM